MKKSPPMLYCKTGRLPKTRFVKGNLEEKLERGVA